MFRLLCIDDNKNNLFTLESILNQLKHIEIISALSAQEGLSILLQQDIDLILLDVQMPEMNGFEAARLIKANKKTTDIPIIFLTAIFQGEEFQTLGFKMGALEYLTKPIDDNKLLNKVGLYQRLIESEKELYIQKSYLQKIIDLQEQILLVVDRINIFSANQRFFDFFGYRDLDDFFKDHQCISELFINKEGFLDAAESDGQKVWLMTVINHPEKMHLAIVKYFNADVFMLVHAVLIDAEKEIYVITLSDVTQMHRMKEQFRYDALIDKLTGAFNRTKLDAIIDNEILTATVEKTFSLAMLDIDYFKKINDEFGHLQGDSILKELVILIEDNIRNEDLLIRWGGEEFFLVFFISLNKIRLLVERIHVIIAQHPFSGMEKPVTVSIGVGEYTPGVKKDVFLKQIDEALYHAKRSGRNCVKTISDQPVSIVKKE
jgi:diguanylate cyclase (GGDEF)-like protein